MRRVHTSTRYAPANARGIRNETKGVTSNLRYGETDRSPGSPLPKQPYPAIPAGTRTEAGLADFVPHITGHVFRKRNPGWRILPHTVNDYDITYIIKGSACYTINGVPHDIESGDLLCLTNGDLIEAVTYPQNQTQCFEISFTSQYNYAKKIGGGGGGG
ncbi:MAG: AraC family ligand binding domain-containing protein, partial [Treponema sp.]|nr:AraC family ligand binding domain-containing protein [Treponema sp.]